MPIFEYQCHKCNHCFERLTIASDEESALTCPRCGAVDVAKLMSCANALGGTKSSLCAPGSSGYS
jgi:putative FmdB family regulatory protein